MRLKLVKQGNFLGTYCDFYTDESNHIFMSRTQIGYALEYKNPSKGIENIHNRHHDRLDNMSIITTGDQIEGGSKHIDPKSDIYMYTEKGIYEICRHSKQHVSNDFYDWVYETIGHIRINGYYIASEKDNKWIGIRQETKEVRKAETDQIKEFVEYAKAQGSKNANRYYIVITKLVNGRLGMESGGRDKADQKTLMWLKGLETVIDMHLATLMSERLPYKQIYQDIKKFIETL